MYLPDTNVVPELRRQRAVTLQGVERPASAPVLSCPGRQVPDVRRLRPNSETEATAMRAAIEREAATGRRVRAVHEESLEHDVTGLDPRSGELHPSEVRGLAGTAGSVLPTPNGRHVSGKRRDCRRLHVATDCANDSALLESARDPARFPWREAGRVRHHRLEADVMAKPGALREDGSERVVGGAGAGGARWRMN